MSRPTITLAMIVKNEAENLPGLLKSVEGCFDDILITDTGSTDDTVGVALSLGARVQHFEWCDDFSAARNASFQGVTTDYVMWLDGDDVLENREGFINWRDTAMNLADYWVATYHYSSDPSGKAVCSFARERVFKVDKGMQWKYFVHEGVMPVSKNGDVRSQFVPSWAVRHVRTAQDLEKDKSRNLRLFERHKGTLDARMQYYYGKELFESGQPVEAAAALLPALTNKDLELHDRLLGYQYACYAYMQCNQFERSVDLAHCGLQLAPNRAEFHTIIGDCYMKLNRVADAVPFYHAAKGCKIQSPMPGASAVFHNESAYTTYPANQLARVYFHSGEIDRGLDEASHAALTYDDPESKQIRDEILRIKRSMSGYKFAKPCDDIVITCPAQSPYVWDADIAKEKSMGGSETAAIEMASWLHKISGRPVKIFNMRESDKVCDGVEYISAQKVHEYMSAHKPWLHIAWRHNFKLTNAPTYLWCHDLITQGGENHANYEKILALTPFHKRFLMAMQGIPEHKIHVTRNGIRPERFDSDPSIQRDPWKFVFSSSPDRGLDRAMRVLDIVRQKHPKVKLHIYYGIEHLDKFGQGALAAQLKAMMDERKDWVIYHGATQQDELMREFKSAAYCVQPSDFIETSMISAMERLCCGVYQIIRAVGGAVDTLAEAAKSGMATLVESDCLTEREYAVYAENVCAAIYTDAYECVKVDPSFLSWESVAREWLRDFPVRSESLAELKEGA